MRNLFLENSFSALFSKFSDNEDSYGALYAELTRRYSEKHRFYHTYEHIEHMLRSAQNYRKELQDAEAVDLAIWFHDAIYDPFSNQNEKKSAEFAAEQLEALDVSGKIVEKTVNLILSTERHLPDNADNDGLFFLDFDLAVLGSDESTYENYTQKIRKEFRLVPDFLFREGRKKILKKFLTREKIFFTKAFFELFEEKARRNLTKEIEEL